MSDDTVLKAFMRKYDRIYNPVANAEAIDEQNAQIARRVRLSLLYKKRDER